jgi:hypothetical protein
MDGRSCPGSPIDPSMNRTGLPPPAFVLPGRGRSGQTSISPMPGF